MIRVIFHNMDKSELVRQTSISRLRHMVEKFPDLDLHNITLTLSMENSPRHAGPDVFKACVRVRGAKYSDITLEKSAGNLYQAIAEVSDGMLERLNRFGDRQRVRNIRQQRVLASAKA